MKCNCWVIVQQMLKAKKEIKETNAKEGRRRVHSLRKRCNSDECNFYFEVGVEK